MAFLLTPQALAQGTSVFATKLFATDIGSERVGLAYDAATQRLYTVSSGVHALRGYSLDGTLVAGPFTITTGGQPVPGANGLTGIHFLEQATTIGGSAAAAGSLVFLQAGLANDPQSLNETTLYVLDKTTGASTASEVAATGFLVPPAACSDVLKDNGRGLGYSAQRDVFVTVDLDCQGVAEIDGGDVLGFYSVPGGIAGTSGGAGVTVNPVTGNTWVGGAILAAGSTILAEFSPAGELLQWFTVFDVDTQGPVTLRRLTFDDTGQRLFLLTFAADVYELSPPPVAPIRTLPPWGVAALASALGLLLLAARVRSYPKTSLKPSRSSRWRGV